MAARSPQPPSLTLSLSLSRGRILETASPVPYWCQSLQVWNFAEANTPENSSGEKGSGDKLQRLSVYCLPSRLTQAGQRSRFDYQYCGEIQAKQFSAEDGYWCEEPTLSQLAASRLCMSEFSLRRWMALSFFNHVRLSMSSQWSLVTGDMFNLWPTSVSESVRDLIISTTMALLMRVVLELHLVTIFSEESTPAEVCCEKPGGEEATVETENCSRWLAAVCLRLDDHLEHLLQENVISDKQYLEVCQHRQRRGKYSGMRLLRNCIIRNNSLENLRALLSMLHLAVPINACSATSGSSGSGSDSVQAEENSLALCEIFSLAQRPSADLQGLLTFNFVVLFNNDPRQPAIENMLEENLLKAKHYIQVVDRRAACGDHCAVMLLFRILHQRRMLQKFMDWFRKNFLAPHLASTPSEGFLLI